MDEAGASGVDSAPAEHMSSRFYPVGTVCPGCGYSMAGCGGTCCPECGGVTADLAYPGVARGISEAERERAAGLGFSLHAWAVLAAARDGTGQLMGVLVLFGILGFVVWPLLRSVDRMESSVLVVARAAGTGAAVFAACALVHVGTTWGRVRREVDARRDALAADLARGRVEEYHHELTHAMRIPDGEGECLLLRFHGGFVLGLRPAAQRRLGIGPEGAVGGRVRLSMLPRSRGLVGIEFEGEPTPTSRRPDLRLRRAHPGAGDPVVASRAIGPLVRVPRGTRPAFAPDGPPATR